MSWSKMLVSAMLVIVSFNGCAEIVDMLIDGPICKKLQDTKEPLYLETVDNEEFKKFVLEKNLIKGLKENDIVWVDNLGNKCFGRGKVRSAKILLAKRTMYEITMLTQAKGLTNKNYKNHEYKVRPLSDYFFTEKGLMYSHNIITKIVENQNGKELDIENNISNLPWSYGGWFSLSIKSRYNDINKIKSIIDEQDYVQKLQADSAQK